MEVLNMEILQERKKLSGGIVLAILICTFVVLAPFTASNIGTEHQPRLAIVSAQETAPLLGPSPFVIDSNGITLRGTSVTLGWNAVFKAYKASPTSCSGLWFIGSPLVCLWREAVVVISSLLISVSAWLLGLSGLLFDWVVQHTIVAFGAPDEIFSKVKPAVDLAWTAFRDIANILIIGVFTFIAISIIIGNKEFGQKKMIARVLIIAVLMNFSLLFTKMIIDASNFTARQFHAAAALPALTSSDFVTYLLGDQSITSTGIAGKFINFLGVSSIGDTYRALDAAAEKNNSGWVALVHALLSMTILLATALVFLYGTFLLVSRAILLIFLMLTSSIAFATHLIPKASGSAYGWDTWWSSLLKVAVLAPLLMVFLWATVKVGETLGGPKGILGNNVTASIQSPALAAHTMNLGNVAAGGATGDFGGTSGRSGGSSGSVGTEPEGGTLGDLIMHPEKSGNLNVLFNYLVILGMLFMSFKVASSLSSKIAGFNFAAAAAAIPLGLGARLAGFAARQTIGRGSSFIAGKLQDRAKNIDGVNRPLWLRSLYDFGARQAIRPAKRDFNVANTRFGKEITGIGGLKGKWAGESKVVGGFEGSQKTRAKAFAEQAKRMNLSKEEKEKMRTSGINAMMRIKPGAEQAHTRAGNAAKVAEEAQKRFEGEQAKMMEKFTKNMSDLQRELGGARRSATLNPNDNAAKNKITEIERKILAQKERQLAEGVRHTTNINKAKRVAERAKKAQASIEKDLEQAAIEAGKLPKDFKDTKTTADLASELAHNRLTNSIMRVAGWSTKETDDLAKRSREAVGEQQKTQNIKDIIGVLEEERKKAEGETGAPKAAPQQKPRDAGKPAPDIRTPGGGLNH